MDKTAKIFVAGHRGLVGSAIFRKLTEQGYRNLVLKTRAELDLLNQVAVDKFFKTGNIEYVFLAAAKVGGIMANQQKKADFIYENLQVQNNVIYSSYQYKVKKLLFLGSSCIYPRNSAQPIKEEYLLTGELEKTNDAYAIAKIAGIKLCQSFNAQYGSNFISVMPTNLYGSDDNFDLVNSHVLPALIRKFYEAKLNNSRQVELWGTGSARREFLHVDDLADAVVYLMNNYDDSAIINIGTGEDLSIKELAMMIKDRIGYGGSIVWDPTKPDGTPRKLLDVSKLNNLGWKYKINLEDGLDDTIRWFSKNYDLIKK